MTSSTDKVAINQKDKWEWQWQSNPNPWDKKEAPQWTSYPLDQDYLIEKAYYDQKNEVEIGGYIVSLKHKLQTNKGNAVKQRPIRRINLTNDVEEIDRSQRYFETEQPKTINSIFGGLGDFVTFFSRRNQAMLDFTNQFKELEQSNNLDGLNQKITPKLVCCFEEELLKPLLQQLKDSSLTPLRKKILLKMKEPIEDLICMFKKEFLSFEEFHGHILKAYTMNTSLYSDINNYLRNESWIGIDKLSPYAFCLCKTFFNPKLQVNLTQDKNIVQSKMPNSMFLYRGTAFDNYALSFYDMKRIRQFSWYSFTSTTTSKAVAEEFMYKSVDIEDGKFPVLFIIEIPVGSEFDSEYLKWIAIHLYSAIPKEEELVLAPGSVFELIDVSTDQDNKTTIKIQLRNEVKSLAHQGMMMQGTLQSQMMTEKEAKVMCLEEKELDQALMSLRGNTLLEEVEFSLCKFDKKSLNEMFEILPTLKKTKTLKLRACINQENGKIAIQRPKGGERCEITKIEVIEANDFFKLICNEICDQEYWVSLRELDLDFRSQRSLTDEELNFTVCQVLKYLPQLTHLKINFEGCEQITDEGVNNLAKGLNFLIQLMDLSLSFQWCQKITDNGVHSLMEGLNSLVNLTHLNLNFKECKLITDTGMKSLSQRLNSFARLTHLNLNFRLLSEITDLGMNSFSQALNSLTRLKHLDLDLGWWGQITDKGMDSLAQCLNSLTKLTHINLHFGGWRKLTYKGVRRLMSKGLINLTQLTTLILDFNRCEQILSDDLDILAWEWVHLLNSATPLIVKNERLQTIDVQTQEQSNDFPRVSLVRESFCQEEHKQAFYEKVSLLQKAPTESEPSEQSEKFLTQDLMDIMVSIWRKDHHTFDDVARALKFFQESPQHHQITSLTFDFEAYSDIFTNDFVYNFSSQVLLNLSQLSSLTLIFDDCYKMTDEGMRDLALYGLKNLTGLTSLKLKFIKCESVTDQGLTDLAQKGLRYLSQLKSFTLYVFRSERITTNKGLINLAYHGLRHLSQLEDLSLQFDERVHVSDRGVNGLMSFGLKNLKQLKFLVLCLASSAVTDKGVNNLILNVIKKLPKLAFLDLNLFGCSNVSGFTVQNLRYVLHYFGFTKEIDPMNKVHEIV